VPKFFHLPLAVNGAFLATKSERKNFWDLFISNLFSYFSAAVTFYTEVLK
jgi:hypothetical protein